MGYRSHLVAALILAALATGRAHAGSVTNGVWTPSGCGEEPKPVTIDLSSSDAFSKSLDANDQYEEKSKTYDDCMFKEAGADGQAINAAQKKAQDERAAAVQKNEADIKTGLDKYAKKK